MQKYLKWEDVLNRFAHSFLLPTTQICACGLNTFLKLTQKKRDFEIVQLTGVDSLSHILMSLRRICMII